MQPGLEPDRSGLGRARADVPPAEKSGAQGRSRGSESALEVVPESSGFVSSLVRPIGRVIAREPSAAKVKPLGLGRSILPL